MTLRRMSRHFRDCLAPAPSPLHARLVGLFSWMLANFRATQDAVPIVHMQLSNARNHWTDEKLDAWVSFHDGDVVISHYLPMIRHLEQYSSFDAEQLAHLLDPVAYAVDMVSLDVRCMSLDYHAPDFALEGAPLLASTVGGSPAKERLLQRVRGLLDIYESIGAHEVDLVLSSGRVKHYRFDGRKSKVFKDAARLPVVEVRLGYDTAMEESDDRYAKILKYREPDWELENRALLA